MVLLDSALPGGHVCPYCRRGNTCVVKTSVVYWNGGTPHVKECLKCSSCGQLHDVSYKIVFRLAYDVEQKCWRYVKLEVNP